MSQVNVPDKIMHGLSDSIATVMFTGHDICC